MKRKRTGMNLRSRQSRRLVRDDLQKGFGCLAIARPCHSEFAPSASHRTCGATRAESLPSTAQFGNQKRPRSHNTPCRACTELPCKRTLEPARPCTHRLARNTCSCDMPVKHFCHTHIFQVCSHLNSQIRWSVCRRAGGCHGSG